MSGRTRHGWARAVVCATALAAPLATSGCASSAQATDPGNGAATSAPNATGAGGAPATGGGTSASAPLNATGGTRLTVSDGTSQVLLDGKAVDFGTGVHDLAWSPDGKHAAFIDATGSLSVADADGSHRVEAAKNPGGQTWSHPTWQVTGALPVSGDSTMPPKDFVFFGSSAGGGTLEFVSGTAHDGTPKALPLGHYTGDNTPENPRTANRWPNAGGSAGSSVYEHDDGTVAQVYIRDDYLRQQGGKIFDDAAEPAFFDTSVSGGNTPDGTAGIVFVRVVAGHKHVFLAVQPATGAWKPVDLTPDAASDCTEPAISPDAKTVAFSTPSGVEMVNADGSRLTKITDRPGTPAFR
jgi:hypothetical protein